MGRRVIYKKAVIKALKRAHVRFQEGGRMVHIWCPFHADRATPSCVIYTNKDPVNFYCFGCRAHGTWDQLSEGLKTGRLERDWDDPEAFKNLREELKLLLSVEPALPPMTRPWTFGAWREFSGPTLTRMQTLWWWDDIDQVRRILFPVWDEDEELVGWVARDLDDRAEGRKYRNMPQMEALKTFWPLPVRGTYPERTCVLVEGVTDALRLLNVGIPALACLGTGWSKKRSALLLGALQIDRVVLGFDGDEPGFDAAARIGNELARIIGEDSVAVWEWSHGRDPGDADPSEVEDLRKEVVHPAAPRGVHPWLHFLPREPRPEWFPSD